MGRKRILLTVPIQSLARGMGLLDVGLGHVAAACEAAGWDVVLQDWNIHHTPESFRKYLESESFDLVGVKVFTQQVAAAKKTLELVKEVQPEAATILGGPHPTGSRPEDLWEAFGEVLDFAMAGDGELGMLSLLGMWEERGERPDASSLGGVSGLRFQGSGGVTANETVFEPDLERLPQRDLSLQKPSLYTFAPLWDPLSSGRAAPVHTGRGCPCRCGYCIAWMINGPKPRRRSLEALKEEIRTLVTVYDVRRISFMDNVFLSDRDYLEQLCEWLIQEGYALKWDFVPTSFFRQLKDPSLCRLVARAGGDAALFGIESGSAEVLRRIRKNGTPEEYAEVVRTVHEAGILCMGYFMFGFPDETLAEMEETLAFSRSLPFAKRHFGICLPFPGTLSHERLLEKHEMERVDWETYDFREPKLLPSQASPEQVIDMFRRAERETLMSWEGVKTLGWMILLAGKAKMGRWRNRGKGRDA